MNSPPKHELIGQARMNVEIFKGQILLTVPSVGIGIGFTPEEALDLADAIALAAKYAKKGGFVQ